MKHFPQRRNRFLFLCLLACFLVTLLVVGLTVWVPYQRTQSVIREFERIGCEVVTEHGGPEWLREWIGNKRMKMFNKVVSLKLSRGPVSDADLEHLKRLTNLRYLTLGETQVTDAGLEHLKRLTNLHYLTIGNLQVSDAGLKHLKELPNLAELSLDGTLVSDAGLEHLEEMTNLQSVWLRNTQVTDDGVKKLKNALGDHLEIFR